MLTVFPRGIGAPWLVEEKGPAVAIAAPMPSVAMIAGTVRAPRASGARFDVDGNVVAIANDGRETRRVARLWSDRDHSLARRRSTAGVASRPASRASSAVSSRYSR